MTRTLFYLILIFLVSCSSGTKDQSVSESEIELNKVKLKELNDQVIDISQFKGKTIFINFWASWCKPCLQEMPSIERAQAQLKNENIVFLLASNEDPAEIEQFIKKHNYTFKYTLIENLEELNIVALPTTFIFNTEGKLKFSESGSRNWDDISSIELITKIMNDHEN